ncbi:Ppx/GppA phosphatase family protein [Chlorobium sp. KB01]|uniref:Ppx/GppA phosphatase family protein n=1 Tax=Chlorobium sp. KB01 TaxID=1917528 RepID=UPI0009774003|nr:Ppx/GppA phosphatase family protein [Chlorobium sp. KB01]
MKRVSCIDIGTNTALLLIADLVPESGSIIPVCHRQTIVRLGKNVDAEKVIDRDAQLRLISCLKEYRQLSDEHGCRCIIAAGTSALRDAANRTEVIRAVKEETGIAIRCISGEEEAKLTFFGAVAGMSRIPEPFSVIDIGGGSTEISMGSLEGITESVSLDIGSVRLTERFFTMLPPPESEFEQAEAEISNMLTKRILPFFASREQVFGVAGTVTTIAQVSQGMNHFDALKVHNYPLSYVEVHELLEQLRKKTNEEIIALGIPEGRSDVITMGTLILHQFMRLLGIGEIRVSIQGLRFGLAQEELIRLQQKI